MAKPEATQFFQFDSKGNMYIYAPGAGCMGDAKLVAPGDELIFSNSTQWEQHDAPLLSQSMVKLEEGLTLTCPAGQPNTAMTREFKAPLPIESLIELSHKNFSAETMKKVRWARKMYREWRMSRESLDGGQIPCDLEDQATITGASLHYALCHFITEIKKLDGTEYPGKTLYDIVICLQFHLECLGFAFKLIHGDQFRDVKYTLDNTVKQQVVCGIGLSVRQAQVL